MSVRAAIEETEEYKAGHDAFEEGEREYQNPHSATRDPDRFAAWRQGYWDAECPDDDADYEIDHGDEDDDDE